MANAIYPRKVKVNFLPFGVFQCCKENLQGESAVSFSLLR